MSLGRIAPAGVAVAFAAAALGFTLHRERVHGAEIQALTKEIAGMRADLAADRGPASAPPPVFARCGVDAEQIQAIAVGVGAVLARAPAAATPGGGRHDVAEPAAERTTEQEVALASAGEAVESIIRRGGTLTRGDMMKVQAQIAAAGDSAESDALRAKIAQAINLGKIIPERPHP